MGAAAQVQSTRVVTQVQAKATACSQLEGAGAAAGAGEVECADGSVTEVQRSVAPATAERELTTQ